MNKKKIIKYVIISNLYNRGCRIATGTSDRENDDSFKPGVLYDECEKGAQLFANLRIARRAIERSIAFAAKYHSNHAYWQKGWSIIPVRVK